MFEDNPESPIVIQRMMWVHVATPYLLNQACKVGI